MQMTRTGNVEENFSIWFQKFELYFVALEKTLKPDNVKCALFLLKKKAIEVRNALTFTDAEGKYKALVLKFKEFIEGKKGLAHKHYVFNNRVQKKGRVIQGGSDITTEERLTQETRPSLSSM